MSTENNTGIPTPAPKRVIRVQTIIDMLHEGKDREQIARELGLTPAERRALFAHKDIAKKKVRKPVELGIEIVGLEDEEAFAPAESPEFIPELEPVADEPEAEEEQPEETSASFFDIPASLPPDNGITAQAVTPASVSGWE